MLDELKGDIRAAHERIAGHIRKTPVMRLEKGAFGLDVPLTIKLEGQQVTGSFKPRGAFNTVLKHRDLAQNGLVAASGGNHGAGVAYVAKTMCLPCRIFVPTVSSEMKRQILRDLGAEVIVEGAGYAETFLAAKGEAKKSNALLIPAFEARDTIEGQGTLALELEQQAPDLEKIIVSVGGSGFIAGVAAWYGNTAQVIGVEPEMAPSLHASLAAGQPVDVQTGGVAADALGCRRVGDLGFEVAKAANVTCYLVTEDEILKAQKDIWRELRLIVEPAAALPLALLQSGKITFDSGVKVGLVLCGSNTDPAKLGI
ncbi:threonine/serine dehydratase [Rhizobium leguminosarum]|uniref:threonine/serine dehydratase n=2 Tax=Rhizobium leguminosarum TaxID=384 RepID=UPI00103BB7E1|nr:threonine/serine dehydratase [Rhizobium leguminosarum]MBY5494254.1 threonine/serine dehydratase [Rhizobium leguminosarum]TBZ40456.1 threonine/serine dehydratase [Rhizobium leguminosarum bv. viciae]TCA06432.1 threonine/serine dehydratase [Rhizobium leguminosarum bv. viciae]TCA19640.1 threonine/serine dehydratase [Rhizobium leguminosarum bv. viciae]